MRNFPLISANQRRLSRARSWCEFCNTRRMSHLREAATGVCLWLLTVACVSGSDGATLAWRACGKAGARTIQCAEIDVPLDHRKAGGPRVTVAINRVLAPGGGVGTLVYNPGGPGASGKQAVVGLAEAGFFEQVAPGFHIVGFDPRGVGDSSAGDCPAIDDGGAGNGEVSVAAAAALAPSAGDLMRSYGQWGERCRGAWGELFDVLGTNQVVMDLEAIRVALAEESLNFLGVSYGTRLGALYAHRFPERTRAILLDAPVQPRPDTVELNRGQFEQTLALHERFFELCEAEALRCPSDARGAFEALLEAATHEGVEQEITDLWLAGLTDHAMLVFSANLLLRQQAAEGSEWLSGLVARVRREGEELAGAWGGISAVANASVRCTDEPPGALSERQAQQMLDEAWARSPHFAGEVHAALVCSGWPTPPDPVPVPVPRGAPPLLIVGGTQDRLTPLRWAEQMRGALEGSTLVRSHHFGHGALASGSRCVREMAAAFFRGLRLPADGSECLE